MPLDLAAPLVSTVSPVSAVSLHCPWLASHCLAVWHPGPLAVPFPSASFAGILSVTYASCYAWPLLRLIPTNILVQELDWFSLLLLLQS